MSGKHGNRPKLLPKKPGAHPPPAKGFFSSPFWIAVFVAVPVLIAGLAFRYQYGFEGSDVEVLQPLINQPVNDTGLSWGSYRAQHYFGLRMRHEASPLFGLMWFEQPIEMRMPEIRHWCNQGDSIRNYAWTEADGRTFGRQTINDTYALIKTDWLNTGDSSFTARVSSRSHNKGSSTGRVNFYFYLAIEKDEHGQLFIPDNRDLQIGGITGELGHFTLNIDTKQRDQSIVTTLLLPTARLDNPTEDIMRRMRASETDHGMIYILAQEDKERKGKTGHFAVMAINAPIEADFEITLKRREGADPPIGTEFDNEMKKRLARFETRFESAFGLEGKGYDEAEMRMARVALSNMIGSVGIWRGYNKVQQGAMRVPYGPHTLLSAVPSRPFFPRGFLWDEGFHQLLLSKFDPVLSLECVTSWLNAMNVNGWIPREMILTAEAEAKVPQEYVAQLPHVANPPSIIYLLDTVTKNTQFVNEHARTFAGIYRRVVKWFDWLSRTQAGKHPETFRWKGRNETTQLELNPKTMASGLDDYPRASHPSNREYHLDLRCWLSIANRVLARLAELFGEPGEADIYRRKALILDDFSTLVERHWDEQTKQFADFGSHSLNVRLAENERVEKMPNGKQQLVRFFSRVVDDPPRERLVTDVMGYVGLFPLIAGLIPATERKYLESVLDHITDPEELWSDYGLRSVSTLSPYYRARNTEHDPPYWRGSIWMPINYLVLRSLREYAEADNVVLRDRIIDTHRRLKGALLKNLAKEFDRTGHLWEHYDDKTGRGGGSHPFTGWTSLILMVMSEPDL